MKDYEKPVLVKYGQLQDITKGYNDGSSCRNSDFCSEG